jgi:hypothetical protein
MASAWKDVHLRDIPMRGVNHLTVVDELANPASPLFDAALDLVRLSKSCRPPTPQAMPSARARPSASA